MKTIAPLLAAGNDHGDWGPAAKALFSAALLAAVVVIAAVLLIVRAWMRRAAASRAPCPGCGTFLEAGQECPNCASSHPGGADANQAGETE